MSKLNFAVYPAIAILSLGAAFAAHAQSAHDPIDSAGYGAQFTSAPAASAAAVSSKAANQTVTITAKRNASGFDSIDHAGYGPMPAAVASTRTRAEVRAEVLAARANGFDGADRYGYGPMPAAASTRSREEVRAGVLAARATGARIADVEGGDVAIVQRAADVDASRVLAGQIDKNVK